MNGRTVVVIVVVLLILIIGWAFYAQTSGEPNDLDGDFFGNNNNMDFVTQDVEGEITNIDRSQIIVDGPTLISLETEAGIQYEVAVPSMGINLCAAAGSLEDTAELMVGERIEVRGQLNGEGQIVPCESPLDYLRLMTADDNSTATTTATSTAS